MVPLAEMFGYATDLRSATQGRATYSMEFDHYEPVPTERRASELLAKARRIDGLPMTRGRAAPLRHRPHRIE